MGRRVGVILILAVGSAAPMNAQLAAGAATLTSSAVADSQRVLNDLNTAVRANDRDAESWYRRGMIAWALAVRAGAKPPVRGLDHIRLDAVADSSLRIAVQLEPRSARYQLGAGSYFRSAPDPLARFGAIKFFDDALAIVRTGTDTVLHAHAALEAGRVRWLRYDSEAHQMPFLACPNVPQSIDSARVIRPRVDDDTAVIYLQTEGALKQLHNSIVDCNFPPSDAGSGNYERAEEAYREAYATMSSDDRAFRHLAMLLADKNRWRELTSVARDRVTRRPRDAWAWLDLGLALHRSGSAKAAIAALDTGTMLLDARERGRLFSFARMLHTVDSAKYAKSAAGAKQEWEGAFWHMTAPLWSAPELDTHTEFVARVVFAELRWTVDELGVRGADSDRGEIYIRYGPPDRIVALKGCNSPDCQHRARCASSPGSEMGNAPMPMRGSPCFGGVDGTSWRSIDPLQSLLPDASAVVTLWDYDIGLTVAFWGEPTYGTARFPMTDGSHIERVLEIRPAAFDNIAPVKLIDMPVSVTRFRAMGDSVDLLLITRAPMTEMREVASNAVVRAHSWLIGHNDDEYQDSTTLAASGLERAVYRVSPSRYLYRVEAGAEGTSVAGRAIIWINADRDSTTGFALKGFGVSDLLLTTAIQPAARVPVRWRDLNVAPLVGAAQKGATLELVWENYEFGARNNETHYTVSISLERQRSAAGRVSASLLGFAANAVGVKRTEDRVTMTYERGGPAAPAAFVEHVSLVLGDSPAGEYRLRLEVTDRVTGRRAGSAVVVAIAK